MRRGKKRKGIKTQRAKPPTPLWATDLLIGNEEQNKEQKKSTQLPWIIQSPPTTRMDYMVSLFFLPLQLRVNGTLSVSSFLLSSHFQFCSSPPMSALMVHSLFLHFYFLLIFSSVLLPP